MRKFKNGDIVYVKNKLPECMSHFRKSAYGIIEDVDNRQTIYEKDKGGTSFFIRFLDGEESGWYDSENVIDTKKSINKEIKEKMKEVIKTRKAYYDAVENLKETFYSHIQDKH